jgi:hypothetical protein
LVEAKDVTVNVLTSAVTTLVIIFLLIPLLKIPVPAVREVETIETKKYYYPFWAGGWNLGTPIEKVILDNEEKTTTYTETGATGLLLGTVKLPAPKNHHAIAFAILISFEAKHDGSAGTIEYRCYDGTIEGLIGPYGIQTLDWRFCVVSDIVSSFDVVTYSIKGVTTLEFRIYLVGVLGEPDVKQYCRNLVVTVVPLYES